MHDEWSPSVNLSRHDSMAIDVDRRMMESG